MVTSLQINLFPSRCANGFRRSSVVDARRDRAPLDIRFPGTERLPSPVELFVAEEVVVVATVVVVVVRFRRPASTSSSSSCLFLLLVVLLGMAVSTCSGEGREPLPTLLSSPVAVIVAVMML